MLESAAEGTGSCGIVVQRGQWGDKLTVRRSALESATEEGERPVTRLAPALVRGRKVRLYAWVSQFLTGLEESRSLIVLCKRAGVHLRRLNIAPRPIANK